MRIKSFHGNHSIIAFLISKATSKGIKQKQNLMDFIRPVLNNIVNLTPATFMRFASDKDLQNATNYNFATVLRVKIAALVQNAKYVKTRFRLLKGKYSVQFLTSAAASFIKQLTCESFSALHSLMRKLYKCNSEMLIGGNFDRRKF